MNGQLRPKTELIKRDHRFQENICLTAEGFLGFEEGILVGNISIIDETILDMMDIICEGETETDETDAPRAPEPMRS